MMPNMAANSMEPERIGGGGAPSNALVVELDAYHGPLGLLLHLIRSQDLDIFDIPVAGITAQFLEVVHGSGALQLDEAGEFMETAAMLLRIKSQMLLPDPDETDFEDPRAELVRRLLEYEQMRELGRRLRKAEEARRLRYSKGYVEERPTREKPEVELRLSWNELMEAARDLVRPPQPPPVPAPRVTVAEKTALVVERLRTARRVEFHSLIVDRDAMQVAVTLLACLELVRKRTIRLRQVRQFSPLWLYRATSGGQSADPVEGT